jgi:RNA polymerase sigma-70 factor (ECF subfamily)
VKEISDDQILQSIRNREKWEHGFRLLLAKYQERLYWAIRRFVIAHEDADDVFQNTMIKVHQHIDRFESKSSLYTWLYRIATNESISYLKRKNKRAGGSLDNDETKISDRLVADPYFDGDAAEIALQEAVHALPEKQKLVFRMRYFEEMSYRDMSAALGTSEGALKASFHHAVKKVEEQLEQMYRH